MSQWRDFGERSAFYISESVDGRSEMDSLSIKTDVTDETDLSLSMAELAPNVKIISMFMQCVCVCSIFNYFSRSQLH
jgi:hypothetical protein